MSDARHVWWEDAVVYEVYPRSFADADGDGVGDLPGLRSRLEYLADLGADAIWLTPFYPSPLADGGYDVSDYCAVDPLLGTMADFDHLVKDAAAHQIRVIVDLVPNHCSSAHPLFRAALAAAPGSPERGRFIFRDGRGGLPGRPLAARAGGLGTLLRRVRARGRAFVPEPVPRGPAAAPRAPGPGPGTLRWLDPGPGLWPPDWPHSALIQQMALPWGPCRR